MNVVGKASPFSTEFFLPLIHCACFLLLDYPGINPLPYPLLGLPLVEFGKKLSANNKAKSTRSKPFQKSLTSFGSIVAKYFMGDVYVNNRAHFL